MPKDMSVPLDNMQYILDGGALLHRIPWQRGTTYDDICQHYCRYVSCHYGMPTIVFDGYQDGPSTKDAAHRRRAGVCVGTTIHMSGSMVFKGKKEDVLSNKMNKHRFIRLLRDHLERQGCNTVQARADADLLIVQTALAAAECTQRPTILVGDDTDLLVLLCFHSNTTHTLTGNLYLRPEPKHGSKRPPRCWNIAVLKLVLGPEVTNGILFIHALLGCDTTSSVHGLGKGSSLKLISADSAFQGHAQVFTNPESTRGDIIVAGEAALSSLYKAPPGVSLDLLRLQHFHQKVIISKSFVDPQVLPPTSAATKFHSLRTYFQVQQWMGLDINLQPEEWGWKIDGGQYFPIMTDIEVAPVQLLEMVRCNCQTDCSTRRCSCRKHNMECSSACGQCRGVCSNATSQVDSGDVDTCSTNPDSVEVVDEIE